jgi:hypothetical protein
MIDRNDLRCFWTNSDEWPKADSEFAFIVEAVLQLGGATEVGWTSEDPWTKFPGERRFGVHRGILPALPLRHLEIGPVDPLKMLASEREELMRLANGAQRFRNVLDRACRLFRDGQLQAFVRDLEGGGLEGPMPSSWWFGEGVFLERFELGTIDIANCFRQSSWLGRGGLFQPTGEKHRYLFVKRRALESCIAQLTSQNKRKVVLARESQFISTIRGAIMANPDGDKTKAHWSGEAKELGISKRRFETIWADQTKVEGCKWRRRGRRRRSVLQGP